MKSRRCFSFSWPSTIRCAFGDGGFSQPSALAGCSGRLVIIALIAAFSIVRYFFFTHAEVNAFTGRKQHLQLDPQSEIAMGLQSRDQMIAMHKGPSPDAAATKYVRDIGFKIVYSTEAGRTPYKFDFHLLADRNVVNAFALPGGQVFMTEALFRLLHSPDEIAGVLGHEIGHVVGRHSSEQIAKGNFTGGLLNAILIGASGSQQGYDAARAAQMVEQLVSLKYGRFDETEADTLGVKFLFESGYDPEGLIRVMEVLKKVSAGSHQPEILSTHPDPRNRAEHIRAEIDKIRAQKKP